MITATMRTNMVYDEVIDEAPLEALEAGTPGW